MKVTKQTGSFQAKSEDGDVYTINEFQEYDSILTSIGTTDLIETPVKKWKTSTGLSVSQVDSKTYRIIPESKIIWKI